VPDASGAIPAMKNYTIRNMTRKEVDIAIEWAAKEGWNPGLYDADCYYSADPNGFFIGLLDDKPIATISAVKYGESFGFLGFYIVEPEYRGKGYGIQLSTAALQYLDGRNIGLDGVVAQQENYKKAGFKQAYRSIRYEGIGGGHLPEHSHILNLSALPFETIDAYDRPFFPANRSRFLKSWINQPESYAMGIMQHGTLAGYGVIRACRSGSKIGPLFADSPELAESIFLALKSKVKPPEPVFLDTPEVNQDAVALAERYGMKVSFETARMYMGKTPDIQINRVFGVTSFEVG
jgi:ribosomal protein S18 acetylase RimI-like enzyme